MKRILSFVLLSILIMSLTACGKRICSIDGCGEEGVMDETYEEIYCVKHLNSKKAFDASKAAYDNVNTAYIITEDISADIYEAWRCAIYDKKDVEKEGLSFLCKKMNITEDEMALGMVKLLNEDDFDTLSDSDKEDATKDAKEIFTYLFGMDDSSFSLCVGLVTNAYIARGDIERAEDYLSAAKSQMKDISDKYSDYEHYPALKGYYTTTSSFFDFCKNPQGSFEQLKSTIEDYRNEARDYNSDLDYIFVD